MTNRTSWKNIDLNLLVTFNYLYRYQSVTVAAEKSFVSQSAMSHSLARLRQLFGDVLFERKNHKMVATDYAHVIAPKIERLLEQVQHDLLVKEPFQASRYQGVCKIGLTDYAEYIFGPSLYDAILHSAPDAQVSFVNVNRQNYVAIAEQEKLDIVLGSIDVPDNDFTSQFLYTEKHVCLANRTLLAGRNELSLDEFVNIEQAMVSPDGHFTTQVDKQLQTLGLKRRVTIASRNFLTIRKLIETRDLIAIVPEKMALASGLGEQLVVMEPPIPVADFNIYLLCYKRKSNDEKIRWLQSIISQQIS